MVFRWLFRRLENRIQALVTERILLFREHLIEQGHIQPPSNQTDR